MSEQKWTKEPWGQLPKEGEIGVTINAGDYSLGSKCVNALARYNPESVRELVEAARIAYDALTGFGSELGEEEWPEGFDILRQLGTALNKLEAKP